MPPPPRPPYPQSYWPLPRPPYPVLAQPFLGAGPRLWGWPWPPQQQVRATGPQLSQQQVRATGPQLSQGTTPRPRVSLPRGLLNHLLHLRPIRAGGPQSSQGTAQPSAPGGETLASERGQQLTSLTSQVGVAEQCHEDYSSWYGGIPPHPSEFSSEFLAQCAGEREPADGWTREECQKVASECAQYWSTRRYTGPQPRHCSYDALPRTRSRSRSHARREAAIAAAVGWEPLSCDVIDVEEELSRGSVIDIVEERDIIDVEEL